ncbi:hypothetical protein DIZ76_015914 [Coccidioides immitis]|nr:hypothetical protein DIZ76_015914 [Coccidioides immitis]
MGRHNISVQHFGLSVYQVPNSEEELTVVAKTRTQADEQEWPHGQQAAPRHPIGLGSPKPKYRVSRYESPRRRTLSYPVDTPKEAAIIWPGIAKDIAASNKCAGWLSLQLLRQENPSGPENISALKIGQNCGDIECPTAPIYRSRDT